jgi:hypothetical protein
MGIPTEAIAIAISDDPKRIAAFVRRVRTRTGVSIPINPLDVEEWGEAASIAKGEGELNGPIATTLGSLRKRKRSGFPPVRLKWKPRAKIFAATIEHACYRGHYGRCSARALRHIATSGNESLAGVLTWVSEHEFPDLYFVSSSLIFESWLVVWHLLKAGKIVQGGAWQRPNLRHNARYMSVAQRWTGWTPSGDTLLSDFDFEYESTPYEFPGSK